MWEVDVSLVDLLLGSLPADVDAKQLGASVGRKVAVEVRVGAGKGWIGVILEEAWRKIFCGSGHAVKQSEDVFLICDPSFPLYRRHGECSPAVYGGFVGGLLEGVFDCFGVSAAVVSESAGEACTVTVTVFS
ncbi:MAG: uncharacterized protein A8A55_0337 [Amphiamblys sp. WSBS2006]|nr:MAG: uncharacterized protein A8A55_0337 [Amphiamblys sp. WSBS2006]